MLPSIQRIQSIAVAIIAIILLAGLGALGWLLGHVLTYDALGESSAHAGHAYMHPVEQGGSALATTGIVLAFLALLLARRPVVALVRRQLESGSDVPWFLAAAIPMLTFLTVELAEGAVSTRGLAVLALGLPLQALLGILVLWLVRALLLVVVRVIEQLDTHRGVALATAIAIKPGIVLIVAMFSSRPMACNAARRAPPCLVP
jgi:hypothetical protein